jgi:hypothetical protein
VIGDAVDKVEPGRVRFGSFLLPAHSQVGDGVTADLDRGGRAHPDGAQSRCCRARFPGLDLACCHPYGPGRLNLGAMGQERLAPDLGVHRNPVVGIADDELADLVVDLPVRHMISVEGLATQDAGPLSDSVDARELVELGQPGQRRDQASPANTPATPGSGEACTDTGSLTGSSAMGSPTSSGSCVTAAPMQCRNRPHRNGLSLA